MSGSESSAQLDELATGCRILGATGMGDMVWGHLSARDSEDATSFWMKSAGYGMEEMTPDLLVKVGPEGTKTAGAGRLHLEHFIHGGVYAARSDVGAVVHSHAESAVAFAATGMALRPIGHEGTLFSPPDIARFTSTGDLIRTRELGEQLAASLGDRNAILLHRHGLVTVGKDIRTAVLTAVFLDKACRLQLQAAAAGTPLSWSDEDEALAKRGRCYSDKQLDDAWGYLLRGLDPVRT
jgi:ribulose-5-phosphate 4-epimerase/fuculose-1-phosphate aldolase